MTPRERAILVAVSICHGLVHCYMLVFPMIYKSLGTALDLKFSGVGFIGMASYLAFGLGALPTGFLCDRLGARLVLVVCIAGMAAASVVAVFAKTETGVVTALVLLGLCGSLYHPAGLSLLSTSIRHLGKGLGIHGMGGTIGDACAPVVAGVVTARLGWSYSYVVLAVVGGIVVAFLLRTFRGTGAAAADVRGGEPDDSLGHSRLEHAEYPDPAAPATAGATGGPGGDLRPGGLLRLDLQGAYDLLPVISR
jgi:MFS family permease